ncbi:YchJ family protein [Sanguibacter sp. 25GB23B1]|uniref:YchJ family protein n=1 Tax=unclassified Sanguibacter TaxID=2645534 RepID=UPI0032AFC1CD
MTSTASSRAGLPAEPAPRTEPAPRAEPTGRPCPCGRGEPYGDCCGPFHLGAANAPSAERLMRSRYSAFVVGDVPYLLATWHPSTRPNELALKGDRRWLGLEIVDVRGGGLLDVAGAVEFVAHSVEGGRRVAQSERSRFVREHGRWFYVDGVVSA